MAGDSPKPQHTVCEKIRLRSSWVRVYVTYAAAIYAFGGGLFLLYLLFEYKNERPEELDTVKDVFFAVLPVATGVITYWFATMERTSSSTGESGGLPSGPPGGTARPSGEGV